MRVASRAAWLIVAAVMSLLLHACDSDGMLPEAGGRPSEVLVVGDTCSVVGDELRRCVAGLPQQEPMFDVVEPCHGRDGLTAQDRLHHNIVVVTIDSTRCPRTTVTYERDVYARRQIVVSVSAPSVESLRRDIGRCPLHRLLLGNELLRHTHYLKRHTDKALTADVARMMGFGIDVPEGMRLRKRGRGFVWLSDNGTPVMANLCLYVSDNRDSVMAVNIKGETDGMHMSTVPSSTTAITVTDSRHRHVTVRRGLWQMTGDAMGGPYVSRSMSVGGRHIVAEAFVFAPGRDKRDVMRRLEAVLMTLRPDSAADVGK